MHRNLIPSRMVEVSNNSYITKKLAEVLKEKLTDAEARDFNVWLGIVSENIHEARRQKYTNFRLR